MILEARHEFRSEAVTYPLLLSEVTGLRFKIFAWRFSQSRCILHGRTKPPFTYEYATDLKGTFERIIKRPVNIYPMVYQNIFKSWQIIVVVEIDMDESVCKALGESYE